MKLGDRVRLTKGVLEDGSDKPYVGRIGTVIIISATNPSLVAVHVDGDEKPYHAFPVADLEKVEE